MAALDDPTGGIPWLLILEFQSSHDSEKLDVLLEEAAILRCRVRHGESRKEKCKVVTAFVYLKGVCPDRVLDMTVPGGFGIRHAPLIWNVREDQASTSIEEVASGRISWGMLFWTTLMHDGEDSAVIARWKEVVVQVVPDHAMRGNLASIALVFAELVGRRDAWKQGLEGLEMTESEVVNEWISMGELKNQRRNLLELLNGRFPGVVPNDVVQLIQTQDNVTLLHEWFQNAIKADRFEQFMSEIKK